MKSDVFYLSILLPCNLRFWDGYKTDIHFKLSSFFNCLDLWLICKCWWNALQVITNRRFSAQATARGHHGLTTMVTDRTFHNKFSTTGRVAKFIFGHTGEHASILREYFLYDQCSSVVIRVEHLEYIIRIFFCFPNVFCNINEIINSSILVNKINKVFTSMLPGTHQMVL